MEVVNGVDAAGGRYYATVATHGLFVGEARQKLAGLSGVITTNTIDNPELNYYSVKCDVSHIFAEAIKRIHLDGGSISELLNDE